jgi:alkylation response protein AidB-like acyl-CoA dehydrogenase
MDVRLSPEQQALRASAAQVVDRLGPQAVGQLDDVERTEKLDAAVAASGWRELRAADGDGPLASGVEVAVVAEELGRGLADVPFLGPTLAAELRRLAGAPVAPGPETVALTPGLAELACVARDTQPAGPIAVDAHGSGTALVLLPAPGGHALGQIALVAIEQQTDLTRRTARPVPSPATDVPGQHRALTDDDVTRVAALGLALVSADLVGVMSGAVQLARDYAAERRQYGAPIGSFQAVQHQLADAFVAMEGSRSAARHAAWAVDALAPDEALAAGAVAKAYAARAARGVCETTIQVHGGIGNTRECLAHVYLRRALLSTDVFGDAGANLERVLTHQGIGVDDGLR